MNQHKNMRGRFIKSNGSRCPDCEKGILQIREIEGFPYDVCNICGYEEENRQGVEKKISAMREAKNYEKNEILVNKKNTNSRGRENHKTNFKQGGRKVVR